MLKNLESQGYDPMTKNSIGTERNGALWRLLAQGSELLPV